MKFTNQKIYEIAYYNHSLANECERGAVDEKRIWRVQAEAVVGFYNAWEKRRSLAKTSHKRSLSLVPLQLFQSGSVPEDEYKCFRLSEAEVSQTSNTILT